MVLVTLRSRMLPIDSSGFSDPLARAKNYRCTNIKVQQPNNAGNCNYETNTCKHLAGKGDPVVGLGCV